MSYALKDEEEARLGETGSGSLRNENSFQSFGTNRNASGDLGASSLFLARALDSGLGSENEKVKIRDLCAAAVGNDPELVEEINVILAQAEKMFGADDLSCLCSVIGETFVGKIVAGIPEQLGILEFPANDNLGRSLYRGQFDEGRRDGLGVLRWGDGTIYEGEFRQVRREEFISTAATLKHTSFHPPTLSQHPSPSLPASFPLSLSLKTSPQLTNSLT